MQVVDASVVVEALRPDRPLTVAAAATLTNGAAAPHLLDIEVVHVLRRMRRLEELSDAEGSAALRQLMVLPIARRPHLSFLPRIWQLRDNLTAYDATYVALAEALGCPFVTADARLAASPGVRCEIVVLTP